MEKDKYDMKIINIEQKTFEISMLMSGFAAELLEEFDGMSTELEVEIPYYDNENGYLTLSTERVYFDSADELIIVKIAGFDAEVIWDDLDLSARDILINELHHKYKSEVLFRNLSGGDNEIH